MQCHFAPFEYCTWCLHFIDCQSFQYFALFVSFNLSICTSLMQTVNWCALTSALLLSPKDHYAHIDLLNEDHTVSIVFLAAIVPVNFALVFCAHLITSLNMLNFNLNNVSLECFSSVRLHTVKHH